MRIHYVSNNIRTPPQPNGPAMMRQSLPIALIIMLTGCVPDLHVREINVEADQSPIEYIAYRWMPSLLQEATTGERNDEQYSDVIRAAMDRVLSHHGYQLVEDDPAAMIVDFQLTVRESVGAYESAAVTDPGDETLRYGLRWWLPAGEKPLRFERMTPEEEARYLEEGTLHIAVFAPDQTPLWHATGHKVLNHSHTRDEHQEVLEKSVSQILARFPSRTTPPPSPAPTDSGGV